MTTYVLSGLSFCVTIGVGWTGTDGMGLGTLPSYITVVLHHENVQTSSRIMMSTNYIAQWMESG